MRYVPLIALSTIVGPDAASRSSGEFAESNYYCLDQLNSMPPMMVRFCMVAFVLPLDCDRGSSIHRPFGPQSFRAMVGWARRLHRKRESRWHLTVSKVETSRLQRAWVRVFSDRKSTRLNSSHRCIS